jgi:hypothetical protein
VCVASGALSEQLETQAMAALYLDVVNTHGSTVLYWAWRWGGG